MTDAHSGSMPDPSSDAQTEPTKEGDTERQRLIDDLAFLVVRQHRRKVHATAAGESESK